MFNPHIYNMCNVIYNAQEVMLIYKKHFFFFSSKNKIEWRVLHTLHKRGLYCITTNAPKVQSSDNSQDKCEDWKIYTAAQDRNIISYSYEKKRKEVIYSTCGGFLYAIHSCPYDAKK